eukprot:108724-Hanusia_phi.AAC.1
MGLLDPTCRYHSGQLLAALESSLDTQTKSESPHMAALTTLNSASLAATVLSSRNIPSSIRGGGVYLGSAKAFNRK